MTACFLIRAAALVFALLVGVGAQASTGNTLTSAQWRVDLRYLVGQIEKTHPRPFHSVSQQQFLAQVATLDDKIPSLTNHQIELEFARLVASLREGHSRISLPGLSDPMSDVAEVTPSLDDSLAFHGVPIRLYSFADGLFVVAAAPEFKELIGAHVLSIDGRPASAVLDLLTPFINRDNDMGARLIGPDLAIVPEVLQALGLSDDPRHLALTVDMPGGAHRSVQLESILSSSAPAWDVVSPSLFARRHADQNFWLKYLPQRHVLYAKVNVIQDSPSLTVAGLSRQLDTLSKARPVEKFVLDIRNCHGGDNQKFRALLLGLVRNPRLNGPGRLFVLIDRGTFSAAVNSASDLERLTNVVFVGEPTAGAPSSWGDPKKIVLPNSGLIARISTVYWRDWTPDESRPWIAPDIPVSVSSNDYFHGRDKAMEAVLAFPARPAMNDFLADAVRAGADGRSIFRLYYQWKTDSLLEPTSTRPALQRAGEAFLAKGDYSGAKLSFAINVHDDPSSLDEALRAVRSARGTRPESNELRELEAQLSSAAAAPR